MSEGLEALKDIREIFTCHDFDFIEKCDIIEKELKNGEMEHTLRVRLENINYELVRDKEKKDKTLDILAKNLGLEMSIDDDFALLFVRIANNRCCIVGSVDGKQYIELLKGVLKCCEEKPQIIPSRETLIREIMSGGVVTLGEKRKK